MEIDVRRHVWLGEPVKDSHTCQTCHPNGTSTYTCLGCHFHTPANVQAQHEGQSASQLANCIRCHPGGRAAD
jgi:hypothetical protein